MQAIGYLRWSTLEQGNSDKSSEVRQRDVIEAFAKERGWAISEMLVDSGKSAFTGANLKTGELGVFEKRVRSGAIDAAKTVLVVEELDRLSRRPPGEMTSWMMPLLIDGLTIAVAKTGQIITGKSVNNDFGSFVSLMSAAFSAYEFSRKQSDRGNGGWEKRRRTFIEEGRAISRHRCRKWLRWDASTNEFVKIPERVAVIEEMFRLRLAGWGKSGIAKRMNELAATDPDYAPWQSVKKAPKIWTVSAIARIVQDPAVTGYIQFCRQPRGADKRTPIGEPVRVYPPVIDEETFARANEERLVQQLRYQGRGRAVANLFGPLARCKECGGVMQPLGSSRYKINKDGSRSQYYPFYCAQAKMSKGTACSNQVGFPYSKVEGPVMEQLLPLALDDRYFRANDDAVVALEGQAAILRRRIQQQTAQGQRLLGLVQDVDGEDDDLAISAYHDARAKLKALKSELGELEKTLGEARGKTSPKGHVVRVADVRARMDDEDEELRYDARTTAKMALKGLIEKMVFDPSTKSVAIHLRFGLGIMIIRADGEAWFWNLHKSGRMIHGSTQEERELVEAYQRRLPA